MAGQKNDTFAHEVTKLQDLLSKQHDLTEGIKDKRIIIAAMLEEMAKRLDKGRLLTETEKIALMDLDPTRYTEHLLAMDGPYIAANIRGTAINLDPSILEKEVST